MILASLRSKYLDISDSAFCSMKRATGGITAGVDSGLSVGDRVVISGTAQLIDNQEVEVR